MTLVKVPAPLVQAQQDAQTAEQKQIGRLKPVTVFLLLLLQALADAQSAEQMQVEWLKDQMAPHFTQKLLRCTRDILKWIGAHDSDAKHQFPILAGSHLPEVTLA